MQIHSRVRVILTLGLTVSVTLFVGAVARADATPAPKTSAGTYPSLFALEENEKHAQDELQMYQEGLRDVQHTSNWASELLSDSTVALVTLIPIKQLGMAMKIAASIGIYQQIVNYSNQQLKAWSAPFDKAETQLNLLRTQYIDSFDALTELDSQLFTLRECVLQNDDRFLWIENRLMAGSIFVKQWQALVDVSSELVRVRQAEVLSLTDLLQERGYDPAAVRLMHLPRVVPRVRLKMPVEATLVSPQLTCSDILNGAM